MYVLTYTVDENGKYTYNLAPKDGAGENVVPGLFFDTTDQGVTAVRTLNEFGSNVIPNQAVPVLANAGIQGGPEAQVNGVPAMTDAEAIADGEKQIREARDQKIMDTPPSLTPSSALANQHAYNRWSMDNRDPSPFGNTPSGQAEKEFLGQKAFGGGPGTGAPVGTSPTDWGLFEQDLIAGSVDPRRAVNEQLQRQGLPTHANRGFLEDTYANYGTLRKMQNPGLTPEPVEMFNEASQLSNELMGMDGNSMNRVDTQGLWDNQFSDSYTDSLGAEYGAVSANGGNVGEQHQYEFNDINNNIAALAPFIGEQNAGYLMTLTQQAYDEYISSPIRNQMTFAVYLRDVKGAGEWY